MPKVKATETEIKLFAKILSNKKMLRNFLIILAALAIAGAYVFTPCSYEDPAGRKYQKKSPLADGKEK